MAYEHRDAALSQIGEMQQILTSNGMECFAIDVGVVGAAMAVRVPAGLMELAAAWERADGSDTESRWVTVSFTADGSQPTTARILAGAFRATDAPEAAMEHLANLENFEAASASVYWETRGDASMLVARIAVVPIVLQQIPEFFVQLVRQCADRASEVRSTVEALGLQVQPVSNSDEVSLLAWAGCL